MKDCNCYYRSASIDYNLVEKEIIDYYIEQFKVSRDDDKSILFFKLKEDAGLVEFTPSAHNPHHNDFFKSDDFSLQMVDIVKIELLKNYINEYDK